MNHRSYKDICFDKKKTLCVIYMTSDDIEKEDVEVLKFIN
jgi:hypothetical protein